MTTPATGLAARLRYSTPPSLVATAAPDFTISEPQPCAGWVNNPLFRYYRITITYRNDRNILSELDYRLHNDWPYGIDYRAAFAGSAPHWAGTELTIESFSDYPPAVVAELRALWERLFTIAPGDDTPSEAPDHNLVTPDPAECPDISAPQLVEDLPTCSNCGQAHHIQQCGEVRAALLAEPADAPDDEPADAPTDDDDDDWPDGIDDILAPSWPTASSNTSSFVLPTGAAAQSIILCIGGVSRVVSAQGVAEALTLASVHTRPRPVITIVLTSQSQIKLRALEAALADLEITATVVAVKAPSGASEQPVGDETRRGALNRIAAAREQAIGDLYVSIENGLFSEYGTWYDRAVVVVEYSPGAPITVVSDGVVFPLDAVREARRRGFHATVGQVLAEQGLVRDHADPHIDLCGTSRETLLRAAVRQALASVLT